MFFPNIRKQLTFRIGIALSGIKISICIGESVMSISPSSFLSYTRPEHFSTVDVGGT